MTDFEATAYKVLCQIAAALNAKTAGPSDCEFGYVLECDFVKEALQQAYAQGLGDRVALEAEIARLREGLKKITKCIGGNTEINDLETARFYRGYNSGLRSCSSIATKTLYPEAFPTPAPSSSALLAVLRAAINLNIGWRAYQGEYPRNEMLAVCEDVEALPEADRAAILASGEG